MKKPFGIWLHHFNHILEPLGTRVVTFSGSYVNAQIPNIEYVKVDGGLQDLGRISSFFSSNFPSNAVRIMSGDLFLTLVMTIFIKAYIL